MRRSLACLTAVVALAAAGCGGGGATEDNEAGQNGATSTNGGSGVSTDNAANGRTLFAAKCGSCHTLAAAETSGTFGPDLDDLKPDEKTVLSQIDHGGGGMPADLYQGEEARTVAKYVAASAGNG